MKKLLLLLSLTLFLASCSDDKEYPPYNIDIEVIGDGTVIGGGEYAFGNTVTLIAEPIENSNFKFTGWYDGGSILSRLPKYVYSGNKDLRIRAIFSDDVYKCEIKYMITHQYDYYIIKGDSFKITAWDLPSWNHYYPFLDWTIYNRDNKTEKHDRNVTLTYTPEGNSILTASCKLF